MIKLELIAYAGSKDDFDRLGFEIYERIDETTPNTSFDLIYEHGVNKVEAPFYEDPIMGKLKCYIWVTITATQKDMIIEYYKTLSRRLCRLSVIAAYTPGGGKFRDKPGVSLRLLSILPYEKTK